MNYPWQFGIPQFALLGLALIAVALLMSSLFELRPAVPVAEGAAPARRGTGLVRRMRLRPRLRVGRGLSSAVVLAVAAALLWLVSLVQTYLGLTGEIPAARVLASPIQNMPHTMSVELTLYDDDGHTESRQTYQVEGDRWVLQANIVELRHWVNVLGVHSGYKVTRLFGQREDGVSPRQDQIMLNGGDDSFYRDMRQGTWWTQPFVRSAYGNAVIAAPGEYMVFISQDAIKTRPVGR
ncbi:MAG: hypothetical protein HOQ24_13270 [Mycobacteriaceae bacterium]|nr:hypothetical protein [Mycobacteriaceae bacterium]